MALPSLSPIWIQIVVNCLDFPAIQVIQRLIEHALYFICETPTRLWGRPGNNVVSHVFIYARFMCSCIPSILCVNFWDLERSSDNFVVLCHDTRCWNGKAPGEGKIHDIVLSSKGRGWGNCKFCKIAEGNHGNIMGIYRKKGFIKGEPLRLLRTNSVRENFEQSKWDLERGYP